jgi:hypothetical protein
MAPTLGFNNQYLKKLNGREFLEKMECLERLELQHFWKRHGVVVTRGNQM